MTFAMLFWIIMLLWLLSWFGAWIITDPRIGYGSSLILWVLLALLGSHVFGAALHG